MSKLSGWSLFWLAMTATCIIATVFRVIQANRKKELKTTDIGTPVAVDSNLFSHLSDNGGVFYLGGDKIYY